MGTPKINIARLFIIIIIIAIKGQLFVISQREGHSTSFVTKAWSQSNGIFFLSKGGGETKTQNSIVGSDR